MIFATGLGVFLILISACFLLALIAELYYLLWWKKQSTTTHQSKEEGPTKKSDIINEDDAAIVEAELKRLQNRLLFTIKEETKEDLETPIPSRKGSRTRSLSDVMVSIDTPITPNLDLRYSNHGFNPLFESEMMEAEMMERLRSSPPPKFKFLRDAEEKLYKKLLERDSKEGSFVRIIVGIGNNNALLQTSSQR